MRFRSGDSRKGEGPVRKVASRRGGQSTDGVAYTASTVTPGLTRGPGARTQHRNDERNPLLAQMRAGAGTPATLMNFGVGGGASYDPGWFTKLYK
jgi:hypothetical protein